MYNFDEIIDRRGTNALFVGNAEGLIACATRFSSGALPQLRIRIVRHPTGNKRLNHSVSRPVSAALNFPPHPLVFPLRSLRCKYIAP